ncbi:MAG TPA: hypothetical protein GX747_04275 [Tenericutes bacterium]|nr:hypothetical protein [Mycoplasmatota bacterium]
MNHESINNFALYVIDKEYGVEKLKNDYFTIDNIIENANSEMISLEEMNNNVLKYRRLSNMYTKYESSYSLNDRVEQIEETMVELRKTDKDVLKYSNIEKLYNAALEYRSQLLCYFNAKHKCDKNFNIGDSTPLLHNEGELNHALFMTAKIDFVEKYNDYINFVHLINENQNYLVASRTI